MNELHDASWVEADTTRDHTRKSIIAAAIELLTKGGRDAVTTRAVAQAAGVNAPTIYRMFIDKSGLLDAVAEAGFENYLKGKVERTLSHDPVEDLCSGWDLHVAFGLSNPEIYKLMFCDPRPGPKPPAAVTSRCMLREHIRRIAVTGRLKVSESRAEDLVHASAGGIVLAMLATPNELRDPGLCHIARDTMLAAIVTNTPTQQTHTPSTAAVTLKAVLSEATSLSQAERTMLEEWLERIAKESKVTPEF